MTTPLENIPSTGQSQSNDIGDIADPLVQEVLTNMQNQGNTGNSQSLPQHPPPEVMMPPVYASLPPQPPPAKPLESVQYINSESFINTELIVVAVVLVGVMLATQSSYMSQLLEQIDMEFVRTNDMAIRLVFTVIVFYIILFYKIK